MKNSDLFYYFGHAGVIEKFFDKFNKRPTFKNREQLFILDTCSSYFFDNISLAAKKTVGGLSLITTGRAVEGASTTGVEMLKKLPQTGTLTYRDILFTLNPKHNFLFLLRYLN